MEYGDVLFNVGVLLLLGVALSWINAILSRNAASLAPYLILPGYIACISSLVCYVYQRPWVSVPFLTALGIVGTFCFVRARVLLQKQRASCGEQ